MHFFLNIIPATKTYQEHRVGKRKDGSIYIYEDIELRKVRDLYRAHLSKHIPQKPFKGAVRLLVKWCFPRGKHLNGSYKTTKPDTDNLNKLLKDIMTELGYWNDDAQVASEIIEKFWADIPGIYVEINELGDGDAKKV
jgi:Holliday junction resolvase RusA-like endonuclease